MADKQNSENTGAVKAKSSAPKAVKSSDAKNASDVTTPKAKSAKTGMDKAAKSDSKSTIAKKSVSGTANIKSVAPKKAKSVSANGKTITIKQIGSPIGRQMVQRQTLIGLGLNKMNRVRVLEDTPSVRGMINKMRHLVAIVE